MHELGYNMLMHLLNHETLADTLLRYVTSSHPIRSSVLVVHAGLMSVENGEGTFTVHNGSVIM